MPRLRPLIKRLETRFGAIEGRPIHVEFRPSLTASRGRLFSEAAHGEPVHAASFIRKRQIVLETELLNDSPELARIAVHELFHFVWARAGNSRRASYGRLIAAELDGRARGELGWPAERAKLRCGAERAGRRWRDYVAESFCDTAACLLSGCDTHAEYTLAARWRVKRARWFEQTFGGRALSI